MTTFLIILHILVSFALIMIILLQTGKGAEMGAMFGGGGSNTLFGSRGPGSFLTKVTAAAGALFMLTSLSLAYLSTRTATTSIVEETPVTQEAPAPPAEPLGEAFAPGQTPEGAPAAPQAPEAR